MLIIARTTGVHTVVMNGDSNTRVIWYCLGTNGKAERFWVVVWKPRVTAQMRRGEAGPLIILLSQECRRLLLASFQRFKQAALI